MVRWEYMIRLCKCCYHREKEELFTAWMQMVKGWFGIPREKKKTLGKGCCHLKMESRRVPEMQKVKRFVFAKIDRNWHAQPDVDRRRMRIGKAHHAFRSLLYANDAL